MSKDNLFQEPYMSAKRYEEINGEARTARRITTPAGVVFAVKQVSGGYKIWRMDQLLGSVRKSTRPTCWIASLPDGKHLITQSELKWCVERLQMATPVSGSITDTATKHYVEQLIKKHGVEEARGLTCGPARDVVDSFIQESDHCKFWQA